MNATRRRPDVMQTRHERDAHPAAARCARWPDEGIGNPICASLPNRLE
jgi:hypothetical protein